MENEVLRPKRRFASEVETRPEGNGENFADAAAIVGLGVADVVRACSSDWENEPEPELELGWIGRGG